MIIDMHCHLDLFKKPSEVAKICTQKDIYILSVTTTPRAWQKTSELANGGKIMTSLGLHPQLAHQRAHEIELFDTLVPKARYIGEVGIDAGEDYKGHLEVQLYIFRQILNSVKSAGGKILSIHSRKSASIVLDELRRYGSIGIPILHWFTGNKEELRKAIQQDCWFSIGPAQFYTQSGREMVLEIPQNRLLPESDAPFTMIRNKKIMPWDTIMVYEKLAQIWKKPIEEVEAKLFENFKELMQFTT